MRRPYTGWHKTNRPLQGRRKVLRGGDRNGEVHGKRAERQPIMAVEGTARVQGVIEILLDLEGPKQGQKLAHFLFGNCSLQKSA